MWGIIQLDKGFGSSVNIMTCIGKLVGKLNDLCVRFHPPLVYGRKGDADVGEGICCCTGKDKTGK